MDTAEAFGTPKEEALAWWKGKIEIESYVGGRDELPSVHATRYLRSQGLLAVNRPGFSGGLRT